MKRRILLPTLIIVAVSIPSMLWAASGSFRGIIVDPPKGDAKDGVIYIKGHNGLVRKVDVSAAVVSYGGSFPAAKREKKPAAALKWGTDVRVTAEQDQSGDWKATQVEIVDPNEEPQPSEHQQPALIDEHTSVT